MQNPLYRLDRRRFLWASIAVPNVVLAIACSGGGVVQPTPQPTSTRVSGATPQAEPTSTPSSVLLSPTPECRDDGDVTPAQTEGPYFTPNSPERTSLLETGMAGTRLTVSGYVVTRRCQPVARALLDFWQADDAGAYDNVGYKLRGHQFTDGDGRFQLETIVPVLYPGRTRHIHVKVQAPNRPILTTQLYFPGEARNGSDGIYSSELLLNLSDSADGKRGSFTFVLNIS